MGSCISLFLRHNFPYFFFFESHHQDKIIKSKQYFFPKFHNGSTEQQNWMKISKIKANLRYICGLGHFHNYENDVTATGLEPRTTQFLNEHSTIWPNWRLGKWLSYKKRYSPMTVLKQIVYNHLYMHTLILFTGSSFHRNVKKKFLKIEYVESLLELVLSKICRTLFR